MEYVATYTSIPIPRIHAIHTRKDGQYVEMVYIKGNCMREAWLKDSISADEKSTIRRELKGYVDQLRNLPPPEHAMIASATQGV